MGVPSSFICNVTGLAVTWEHWWEGVGEVGTWLELSWVTHWEKASLTWPQSSLAEDTDCDSLVGQL